VHFVIFLKRARRTLTNVRLEKMTEDKKLKPNEYRSVTGEIKTLPEMEFSTIFGTKVKPIKRSD